mmetsp:Transcript_36216/g.77232  ORF Transcript_36216/g.77232 Transcript_36216/m.77232 type:complete len:207 (-) Transcript_36216:108-728(-)
MHEVGVCLWEVGVRILGLSVRGDGVVPPVELAEHVSHIVVNARVVLVLEVESAPVGPERIHVVVKQLVRRSEVKGRIGVEREQRGRDVEAARRLLVLLARPEQDTQLVVVEARLGLERDAMAIQGACLGGVVVLQRTSQIEPRGCMRRCRADGIHVTLHRFMPASVALELVPEEGELLDKGVNIGSRFGVRVRKGVEGACVADFGR